MCCNYLCLSCPGLKGRFIFVLLLVASLLLVLYSWLSLQAWTLSGKINVFIMSTQVKPKSVLCYFSKILGFLNYFILLPLWPQTDTRSVVLSSYLRSKTSSTIGHKGYSVILAEKSCRIFRQPLILYLMNRYFIHFIIEEVGCKVYSVFSKELKWRIWDWLDFRDHLIQLLHLSGEGTDIWKSSWMTCSR